MILTAVPELAFDRRSDRIAQSAAKAAGIVFLDSLNQALFMRRSPLQDNPGTWAWPAGNIEEGETAEQAALREAGEETGWGTDSNPVPQPEMQLLDHDDGFSTFVQHVPEQFEPKLNDEHTEFKWAPLNDPPQPLHPGVKAVIDAGYLTQEQTRVHAQAQDAALAFDRSVRSYDKDNRLHVAVTNITKANICEYLGSEIPDFERLGLDPLKLYKLLRDPEELKKAVPTFNNAQLLSEHKPVSSEDHSPDLTVGSLGTDAEFVDPYLRNSLVIWSGEAIDEVESGKKKELSASYRYRADMTPGTFRGGAYDGVMRDISCNHVALVKDGRVGTDVVVNDSKLQIYKGEVLMPNILASRKALLAQGAVMAFLLPRLANDAKVDIGPIFADVTAKNFKEKSTGLLDGLKKLTKDKLAKDASIDTLDKLLDVIGSTEPEGVDALSTDPNGGLPPEKAKTMDGDLGSKIKALLEGQVPPELLAQIEALFSTGAVDADNPFAKKEDDKKVEDAEIKEPPVTKSAMDAAIKIATKLATDAANKVQQDIREAERFVRPWVGQLVIAFDSAEAVYSKALELLGQDAKGIHASALPALIKLCPKPGESKKTIASDFAMDGAAAADFAKRYPNASRIQSV